MVVYWFAVLVINVACGVTGQGERRDNNPWVWMRLHNRERIERDLKALVWNVTLAKRTERFIDRCVWSEPVAGRDDTILFLSVYGDRATPYDMIRTVTEEKIEARNRPITDCCNPTNILCCTYAKIMTTKRKEFACFGRICSMMRYKSGRFKNSYFGMCRYR